MKTNVDKLERSLRAYLLKRKLQRIEAARALKTASTNVTPDWIEFIICLILSPVIIPVMVYASVKWIVRKVRGEQ